MDTYWKYNYGLREAPKVRPGNNEVVSVPSDDEEVEEEEEAEEEEDEGQDEHEEVTNKVLPYKRQQGQRKGNGSGRKATAAIPAVFSSRSVPRCRNRGTGSNVTDAPVHSCTEALAHIHAYLVSQKKVLTFQALPNEVPKSTHLTDCIT